MSNDDNCGGTGGCYGATAELAFDYLAQYGLPEAWVYGYLPEVYWNSYTNSNGACIREETYTKNGVSQSAVPRSATATGYELLPRNDYNELMNAVAHIGPMAINIDASEWHSYESGIFTGCAQDNVDINHVVQLVGYGTTHEGQDYWTVRNSWSPTWGENGKLDLLVRNVMSFLCVIRLHTYYFIYQVTSALKGLMDTVELIITMGMELAVTMILSMLPFVVCAESSMILPTPLGLAWPN